MSTMKKSDGVRDIVKWMKAEIKEAKKELELDCSHDFYMLRTAEIGQMISWKISTEKYMKKLIQQGE